jgi:small-conductance mechanosensitive channel
MIGRRGLFPASFATFLAAGGAAWAQSGKSFATNESLMTAVILSLTERFEGTIAALPGLAAWLVGLPSLFGARDGALLAGIVIVGLGVEWGARALLQRARLGIFERHAGETPMRGLMHGALLDLAALLALWVSARLMAGLLGPPESLSGKVAHQLMLALLYWRGFNFVFRIWLRPNTPDGRVAPVDDATAARLLIGMNVVIVLPLIVRQVVQLMTVTGAEPAVMSAGVLLVVPLFAIGSVYTVWHWRRDMAAWLAGMVDQRTTFSAMKLGFAHSWWVGGLAFYLLGGVAAVLAALTERSAAMRGLATVESLLIMLVLIETLVHRLTRHLPTEIPTVGDVVAGCARLALRLLVIVVAADALLIGAFGVIEPVNWVEHNRAVRIAALSTFGLYLLWRFLKYRMDRYIADNPLPSAGFNPDAEDDAPQAATRLRTIMPVLRVVAGVAIVILGSLLVLSELGINTTPLIAGFSVLGLAISFGSQSLVRDIVSGIFFLAEDSFRVGEYIDGGRAKGVVEGFSVRSIRLRHQNGQLNIVPFGQITHITNFSRDWSTVKFNLAFALNTDVELLRKTVKKIGLEMMNEPQFQKELLQPLKMQGLVDIKDMSMIVRFKFTARPKNPSMIQRMAIRRMYEQLPKLGIDFAKPAYAAAFAPFGVDPAARQAAQ